MNMPDDGLIAPPVGAWAEQKYRLLYNYARIFSTSMKKKWDVRVYIDLFAGAGKARIRGSSRIVSTSPLLALDIPDKFDKYIFCEKDPDKIGALEHRIRNNHPGIDCSFICGDTNKIVDSILESIPRWSSTHNVLSFCFADPNKSENLHFSTIEKISKVFVDFLILIPIYMDINRCIEKYLKPDNQIIDRFVGSSEWKVEWKKFRESNKYFDIFFIDYYRRRMDLLGYSYSDYSDIIRSTNKNLPLYRMGFFSRHPLADKLWEETKEYSNPQTNLDL